MLGLATVFVAQTEIGISLAAVMRSAVLVSVLAALFIGVAWLVTRDLAKAGLVAGALMLLLRIGGADAAVTAFLLGVLCGGLLIYVNRRSAGAWRTRGTAALNTIAGVLLVIGLGGSLFAEVASVSSVPTNEEVPFASVDAPDIHVLILDAYARADSLERVLGFDNSDFLGELEDRGLTVAADSRANFMYTAPSLVSLFDLGHMGDAGRSIRTERQALRPSDLINRSPALEVLDRAGYETYASIARWERESLRAADHVCATWPMNEFELHLLRSSLIGRMLDTLANGWMAARDRSIVTAEFACARDAADAGGDAPKFVFTHVGSPHLPVIFDRSGEAAPVDVYLDPLEVPGSKRAEVDAAYVEQLAHVNEEALRVIDEILASSPEPPVIIVMSDHGSWLGIGTEYDEHSDLRERFGNLFAASTPGHPNLFPDDVSIGQVLPMLFNAYLGTDIDVPDSRYFFSRTEDIFTLTEIRDPFEGS